MLGSTLLTNADLYLILYPKRDIEVLLVPKVFQSFEQFLHPNDIDEFPPLDKTKLLYHINRLTGVYYLCISLSIVPNIFAITYGKRHSGFFQYYKIITCF